MEEIEDRVAAGTGVAAGQIDQVAVDTVERGRIEMLAQKATRGGLGQTGRARESTVLVVVVEIAVRADEPTGEPPAGDERQQCSA